MPDAICPCGEPVGNHNAGRKRKYCLNCRPRKRQLREALLKSCFCGQEFSAKNSTAKYCSDRCRYSASNLKRERIPCSQCERSTSWFVCHKLAPNVPICARCIGRAARVKRNGPCSVEACDKPARTGNVGLCRKHYYLANEPCKVDGCERPRLGRGLCPPHYSEWHRSQRRYEVTCQFCGERAKVGRKRDRHCSQACAMKTVAKLKVEANAANAGMSVEDWKSLRKPRLSRLEKASRKAEKAAAGKRGRTIWVARKCKICTTSFLTQSSATGRCCSEICTKKNKRENIHDRARRRRARLKNVYTTRVRSSAIFTRDKYRCHICGKKTDPKKSVPHPKAPTIDHLVPLAKGGTHEPANVATACFICNATKRDVGGGEQLALIG